MTFYLFIFLQYTVLLLNHACTVELGQEHKFGEFSCTTVDGTPLRRRQVATRHTELSSLPRVCVLRFVLLTSPGTIIAFDHSSGHNLKTVSQIPESKQVPPDEANENG